MPVYKRKTRRNKITWFYQFEGTNSTRANRVVIKHGGFATKAEAIDAEAARRLEVAKQAELERETADPLPKTLGALLNEFLSRHVEEKLAPKTAERYREMAIYLAPELLALPLGEVTSLHLAREWDRLLKDGGHTRKGGPRPMSAKTVRNIAGLVSSAFSRGIRWGLCASNPVTQSEPPIPAKRRGIALVPSQQDLMRESASGPWCLPEFLELAAASGCRRGEVLALRWTDLDGNKAYSSRSLTQTRGGLEFKGTKTEKPRLVTLPESRLAMPETLRSRQAIFRDQFGTDYRTELDLIFCAPDGSPLRPDSVSAAVSALCKRLKLPKGASLHTLRHSHGSHLLAAGVPLTAVSERLVIRACASRRRFTATRLQGRMKRPRGSGKSFSGVLEQSACYRILPRPL